MHHNLHCNGLGFVFATIVFPRDLDAVDVGAYITLGLDPVDSLILVAWELNLDTLKKGHEPKVRTLVIEDLVLRHAVQDLAFKSQSPLIFLWVYLEDHLEIPLYLGLLGCLKQVFLDAQQFLSHILIHFLLNLPHLVIDSNFLIEQPVELPWQVQ